MRRVQRCVQDVRGAAEGALAQDVDVALQLLARKRREAVEAKARSM